MQLLAHATLGRNRQRHALRVWRRDGNFETRRPGGPEVRGYLGALAARNVDGLSQVFSVKATARPEAGQDKIVTGEANDKLVGLTRASLVILVAAVAIGCGQSATPTAPSPTPNPVTPSTPTDLKSSLAAAFDAFAIPAS